MINPEDLAYREPKKKRLRLPKIVKPNKRSVIVSAMFILGIALGAGGIFGWQYYANRPPALPEEIPNNTPPQAVLGLIESVEKHAPSIPKNEFPSVATVKDIGELSDQAFFDGAVKGDKVMIYAAAKRAYLYRPSTKQLIRQGPVEVVGDKEEVASSNSAVLSASTSAEVPLRVQY
jgi:hypothetical protein